MKLLISQAHAPSIKRTCVNKLSIVEQRISSFGIRKASYHLEAPEADHTAAVDKLAAVGVVVESAQAAHLHRSFLQ